MNEEKRWLHGKRYEGKTVVVLGQGPSFNAKDALELNQHFLTVAIKDTAEHVPSADIIYAADKSWYERTWKKGWLQEHKAIRVVLDYQKERMSTTDLHYLHCAGKHGFSKVEGTVMHGRNSGHQAINMVLNMGAKKIILLGFDMQVVNNKTHFDGCPHVAIPHDTFFQFRQELVQSVKSVTTPIVNCSKTTALKCFPIMSVYETIEWGLSDG